MKSLPFSKHAIVTDGLSAQLPIWVASRLLDSPYLGHTQGVKWLAGNLLKQPAREGRVDAQTRLGQLLCTHCVSSRDRRVGVQFLYQAARAGDPEAQLELGRLFSQRRDYDPDQARHWLQQAAQQGLVEASRLLRWLEG